MMFRSNTVPQPYWVPYDPPQWTEPTYPQWQFNTMWWITCPQCAKLVQMGSIYCPNCGAKMVPETDEKDKLDLILEKLDEILEAVRKE